ncbi:MAG: YkvA family protein [Anaerolineae bacterium]
MSSQGPSSQQGKPGLFASLWTDIRLAWRLFRDREVPWYLKLIPIIGIVYVVSPIDVIPDYLPILGQADDAAILAFAITWFIKLAPEDRVEMHRAALRGEPSPADGRTIDGTYKS